MNVVITGASKGLGKAIATQFAAEGANLLLCARTEETLIAVKEELLRKHSKISVHIIAADLSKKDEVIKFGNWCSGFGDVDVLVNNAGQFIQGDISNEADGVLEKMIEVNLYSAYYLTKVLLPKMKAAQRGHIFNMCSIASVAAYKNGGSYSISKWALLGFSKNLREELKQENIKVTSVVPGAVYTSSWEGSGISPQRMMTADDIATMIVAASKLSAGACVEEILFRPQLGDID